MTTQNKNVPALRFPEFDGDWKANYLGKVTKFENGKAHENDIDENGKYIVVNSKFISSEGNVKKFSNKQISPLFQDDLVMVMSDVPKGKALAKCFYIDKDNQYTLNQRICALKPNGYINKFLFYIVNRNDYFLAFDSGVGQTNLKKDEILKCPLCIPSAKEEQQKIAAFLTAVDEKIQQLTKKKDLLEQYKKGVMQQIFKQEIRFKDDNGNDFADWEEKKLADVVTNHNSGVYKNASLYGEGNNIIGVSDLYSISSINGQEFRRVPLTKDELAKFTLDEGDLIYGESSLVREGIAKTLFVTNKGAGTAFAWHTRRFKVDGSSVNSSYLYYHLNSPNIRNIIMSVSTQTALTGITTKEYFNISILLPEMNEQQKIANFLAAIDEKIYSVNQLVEKTKEYKKGLLQQMFI